MNKYDKMEDIGYTYTWENMPRDEEGFIQLIPKHPIGKTESIKRRFMYTDQPEIILHHGHISITNYKMGDNREFEKSLSVWNKVTFRYELIGGYYIPEYREFCINRGYDLQRLKRFFPNHPMRVVNDPFPSDKIDIDLYAGPRDDFQKVALTFMTHQGMYETIKHTQELIDMPTGGGKQMPDDSMVATPNGFARLDSLQVGDYVIGSDGRPTEVIGIYPSEKPTRCFEVTFKDGRTARCNDEHLWHVTNSEGVTKVVPLSEIMKDYILNPEALASEDRYRYYIPLPGPIQFNNKLGLYEAMMTFILKYSEKRFSEYDNIPYVVGYIAACNNVGIPTEILESDINTRIQILSGIANCYYMTFVRNSIIIRTPVGSKKSDFRNSVIFIIRSLGFMVNITQMASGEHFSIELGGFTKENVKLFLEGNRDYLFWMDRFERYSSNSHSASTDKLYITDIKEVEPTKQRCIKVRNSNHLYVCQDFVVTHNTYCGAASTAYWKHKVIIFVPFSKLLNQWKESFIEFTSLTDDEIMIIQGSAACEKILNGKCRHIKVFICSMDTIASFQKKHGNLKTIELLKATGAYIKIIDEIHRDIRAVSMIEALSNFRLNYYMSASPGRAEQKENWIFNTLFKNVPKFGSDFQTQEEKHITVMIKKFKWTPDYKQIKAMVSNKTGLNIKAYERELINSPQFQRQSFDDAITVLLNWAKGVMKPGKRLMLMAQSIETLYYIQRLAEQVFPGETGVYYGGLSKKEKEIAIDKKIIIATDSSLGTGANIPELQFLIYCSTYSNWLNARQISGRLRKLNDGTQVVYIELLNVGYMKTMRQFEKRKSELQQRSKTGKLFFIE